MAEARWPLIDVAIEARFPLDRARLATALRACAEADAAFRFAIDSDSGQVIISGMSEAHLHDTIVTLRQSYGLTLAIGAPQVAYRETLTRRIEKDYTHKKRSSGSGAFARVKFVFEPTRRGEGTSFVSKVVGGAVPDPFITGAETGIAQVMAAGVLAGFPLMDVKATLIDGAYHDTDSSSVTFEFASRAAFREALAEGQSILLEPVMAVGVTCPQAYAGSVVGDLKARQGRIEGQTTDGGAIIIQACVPLANLFGYDEQFRSFAEGHATLTTAFEGYEPCSTPPDEGPPPAAAVALRS